MRLDFKNKETYEQIVDRAYQSNTAIAFRDESFVVKGENFDVMASLMKAYKGKIDLVYIDPPFNTEQSFSVSKNRCNTISRSSNGSVAYSDMMPKDEFLRFMYERFVLIRELLSESGSVYVHIDTKLGHYFKVMLDEIFGENCFKNDITRIKSNPKNFKRSAYGNEKDIILFYSKSQNNIWNDVRVKCGDKELNKRFNKVDKNGRRYTTVPLHAPGETSPDSPTGKPWRGMNPPEGRHWRTDPAELEKLDSLGLIEWSSRGNPRLKKYADEHKGKKVQDVWTFKDPQYPLYPTQKNLDMLELIVKQSSNERGFVLDCFAGSGTTLLAASKNNRRFIGIDNSPISIRVMQERLGNCDVDFIDFDLFAEENI